MNRETFFSSDRVYRYTLWREFYDVRALPGMGVPVEGNHALHYVQFIGLNPSTADETKDDPTIRRCVGFCKEWGFGALCMTNIFAFRSTQPKAMMRANDPIGPDNTEHLLNIGKGAGLIVAAWGAVGGHLQQQSHVIRLFTNSLLQLHCLGKNSDGSPKHPLYLKKDSKPELLFDSAESYSRSLLTGAR